MDKQITKIVSDTLELRVLLLKSLDDVVNKKITPNDARARAWLARSILDTMRIEMIAAREGLSNYKPVKMLPDNERTIEGEVS